MRFMLLNYSLTNCLLPFSQTQCRPYQKRKLTTYAMSTLPGLKFGSTRLPIIKARIASKPLTANIVQSAVLIGLSLVIFSRKIIKLPTMPAVTNASRVRPKNRMDATSWLLP